MLSLQSRCRGASGASASFRSRDVQRPQLFVAVRSYEAEGVKDLLARDRKAAEIDPAALEAAFGGGSSTATAAPQQPVRPSSPEASSSGSSTSSASASRPAVKSKGQRRRNMAKAADEGTAADDGPKRCKDAIDAGLALFQERRYPEAINNFNLALELPGNGAYRLPGSPREYSCPSDAEEQAVMYNMACCYAQLGQAEAALTCIEAALESGFDDLATLERDPDLAPVRGAQLQLLLAKHTGVGGAIGKLFGKKERVIESDDGKNKPWLLW